jgi:GNAT superfamily N-acetyltransferase
MDRRPAVIAAQASRAEPTCLDELASAETAAWLGVSAPEWLLDYLAPTWAERARHFHGRLAGLIRRAARDRCDAAVWRLVGADGVAGMVAAERLAWDTTHFGLRCGRLGPVCLRGDLSPAARHAMLDAALEAATAWAESAGISVLHRRLLAKRGDEIDLLEGRGFRLVDTMVTLTAPTAAPADPAGAAIGETGVRQAGADDLATILALTRGAFPFSRFHNDPALDPARADEVYLTWVENVVAGNAADAKAAGTQALVAEQDGAVAGYAIWRPNHEVAPPLAQLELFVVDPSRRGEGVGGRLLKAVKAAARDAGANVLEASTWTQQRAVLEAYTKSGFSSRERLCSYHLSR